ncbi:MAG: hypothetical protein COB50_03235 [Thiotrichales bacterium]|nr:MAG: hypothetical protein COB50_03235 [Thiotrichales bacterium]
MRHLVNKIPKHYLVASAGWVSRVIIAVIRVIMIPLLIYYLGTQEFAVFVVITGLTVWFNLADCGFGSGIQNAISNLRIQKQSSVRFLQRILVYILLFLVIELIIFSLVAYPMQHFLFRKLHVHLLPYLLTVFGCLYIVNFFLSIGNRIFFAHHKGYLGYVYQTLGYAFGLLAVLSLYGLGITQHKLLYVLLAWILPQTLFSIVSFLHAVPLSGWIQHRNWQQFKDIFTTAWQFGVIAFSSVFALGIDYIVMSQVLSAETIVTYNVISNVFNFILFGYSAILMSLWPVFAEKFASNNAVKIAKVNKLIVRNIVIGVVYIIICSILVILFSPYITKLLSHGIITIPITLVCLFGTYYAARVFTDTYSVVLQSQNKIKIFLFAVPAQALVAVFSMYYLAKYFGLFGVVFSLILCFLTTVTWIFPLTHYMSLNKFKGR